MKKYSLRVSMAFSVIMLLSAMHLAFAEEQDNNGTMLSEFADRYKYLVECELYRKKVPHYASDSDWIDKTTKDLHYPENDGFFPGSEVNYTLKKGMLISRYGPQSGHFAAPEGASWQERALAPGSSTFLYVYQVEKDIPVKEGLALPWFNELGCGVQYKFQFSMAELIQQKSITLIDSKIEHPPINLEKE